MIKKRLCIYGAGGMAQVVADTAQLNGWEIIGFIDDTPNAPKELGGMKVMVKIPSAQNDFKIIVAIGDCDARLKIAIRLEQNGYCFATIVHPNAHVSKMACLGTGVFIAAGAVIDPHVSIGNHTIINNNAVVSHGSVIGKACHLAPQSAVAGNCTVDNAVWVGLGAKVIEKRHLASRTFIGAGAIVIHDTNPNTLVYGIPAREVKGR